MTTTPEPTPCNHKWFTYQFVESITPQRICNVCGINERDLPPPEVEPTDPDLWSGYGI